MKYQIAVTVVLGVLLAAAVGNAQVPLTAESQLADSEVTRLLKASHKAIDQQTFHVKATDPTDEAAIAAGYTLNQYQNDIQMGSSGWPRYHELGGPLGAFDHFTGQRARLKSSRRMLGSDAASAMAVTSSPSAEQR